MNKSGTPSSPYYQFGLLSKEEGLLHFVSSGEQGNCSNLSFVDPDALRNRRSLAEAVGFEIGQLTVGEQTHSTHVAIVRSEERGRGGCDNLSRIPDTDALVTAEKGVCLMVLTADCVPVLLYDPVCRVVAAVHAGWKGTVGKIVIRALDVMKKEWGCRPENVLAAIGPSIGKCCFEVGEEMAARFEEQGFSAAVSRKGNSPHVDLREANKMQLLSEGVSGLHIELARVCTKCTVPSFFSYRGGDTDFRFGTGIMLK